MQSNNLNNNFKPKRKSQVSNYMLYITILFIAVISVTYLINIYLKGKDISKNNPEPSVKDLGGNVEAVKDPNNVYKIKLKEELLVTDVQDLKLKIKDEEGNVICTCYYKKDGNLVCRGNCSIEG